jgi:general L-amino acid transport system permease protein
VHLGDHEPLQQFREAEGALIMSDKQIAFVRTEMLPEQEPPATERGVIKWVRENLFPDVLNSILTLVALFFIYKIVSGAWPWFANGIWGTSSLSECREILQGGVGACFSVLAERWNQLLFGFTYPATEYWRPTMAFLLLFIAAAPLLFAMYVPRKVLYFTALYPFIAFYLIWGGTIIAPLFGLFGFVAAAIVFPRAERAVGFAAALGSSFVAALVVWAIGGMIAGAMPGFLALEAVPSRDMGGFMLNFILGTVCVSLSLPIGIVLALGRQSRMPIIKWICVVFIEFIRGVPLITLLFVANVVLAYFLPPGTNFDLILRVIIMITLFSSAYIAEVIRGGLAALPRGQYEAADSLGLDYAQSMRLIIMPQALKISIPGIVNVAVGLFKDTTLVSVISMFDLVGMIRGPILASTEWNGVYWELWGFAILMFFPVCYGISQYSQWLERQLATDHR